MPVLTDNLKSLKLLNRRCNLLHWIAVLHFMLSDFLQDIGINSLRIMVAWLQCMVDDFMLYFGFFFKVWILEMDSFGTCRKPESTTFLHVIKPFTREYFSQPFYFTFICKTVRFSDVFLLMSFHKYIN